MTTPDPGRNWGDLGEDFVESVFREPLGRDFLFRGPRYATEKGEVELCDLLVLMEDTAILVEVKTADRHKRPNRTEEAWSDFANKRLARALEQIERGISTLRSGGIKSVENARQGVVLIEPARIKHYFGIAIVDHPTLDKYGSGPVITVDGTPVVVMTTTHAELGELLRELSTVADLIDYMRAREEFFAKNVMLGITELDLLAAYKQDPDEFRDSVARYDEYMIEEGCWETFSALDARKRRDEADRPAMLVDAIIDKLHEGRQARLPHIERRYDRLGVEADAARAYRRVADELARIRRIDRRMIGLKLIEKSAKCIEQKRDRWFASSPMTGEGTTCVFVVSTADRDDRLETLEMAVFGAMLKMNARRVLGIATEPVAGGHGFSVDAFLVEMDAAELRAKLPADLVAELEAQFGTATPPEGTEFE